MNVSEVESLLQVKYSEPNNYSFRGKICNYVVKLVIGRIEKIYENEGSYLRSIEIFLRNLGVQTESHINRNLVSLVRDGNNSYIFYGDHRYHVEPILGVMGLPERLRERILEADSKGESKWKLFASDMFLIYAPWLINYIFPVILRDSDAQDKQCNDKFLENRHENRGALSNRAIDNSSEYLSNKGSSLFIFPQGSSHNQRWRTGMIRILDDFIKRSPDRLSNTYVVPFACSNVRSGRIIDWFKSALGFRSKNDFGIHYGEPVALSEFMKDWDANITEVEEVLPHMRRKMAELQEDYYEWSKGIEGLDW